MKEMKKNLYKDGEKSESIGRDTMYMPAKICIPGYFNWIALEIIHKFKNYLKKYIICPFRGRLG